MKYCTSDFDYNLPPELIAQTAAEPRDASRLLVVRGNSIEHRRFRDLPEYIEPGDCLVLNDSKVMRARLFGSARGKPCELLLLRALGDGLWECLTKPGKRTVTGDVIAFADGAEARIREVLPDGTRIAEFSGEPPEGELPLPPYIHEKPANPERYQTVYAREPGSAAAPTAGLHFTPELLDALRLKGADIRYLTLHVGTGTFRPVKTENPDEHKMHSEFYSIPEETARAVNETKARGGRVFAVGTTVTRTLEAQTPPLTQVSGETDIFIRPGYEFKTVDCLITNFHLPKSTLLMLVSAKLGRERTSEIYETAVRERYKFFSFGDACLIL